jgi:hypothetical protein
MQFDNCGDNTVRQEYENILLESFPKEWVENFVFIWWDVRGKTNDFPATIQNGGNYLFSGFDGSVITGLLGGVSKNNEKEKPSMLDVIKELLNQEILIGIVAGKDFDLPF